MFDRQHWKPIDNSWLTVCASSAAVTEKQKQKYENENEQYYYPILLCLHWLWFRWRCSSEPQNPSLQTTAVVNSSNFSRKRLSNGEGVRGRGGGEGGGGKCVGGVLPLLSFVPLLFFLHLSSLQAKNEQQKKKSYQVPCTSEWGIIIIQDITAVVS